MSGGEQKDRVVRGGWWNLHIESVSSDYRYADPPDTRVNLFGFRLVAVVRAQ